MRASRIQNVLMTAGRNRADLAPVRNNLPRNLDGIRQSRGAAELLNDDFGCAHGASKYDCLPFVKAFFTLAPKDAGGPSASMMTPTESPAHDRTELRETRDLLAEILAEIRRR